MGFSLKKLVKTAISPVNALIAKPVKKLIIDPLDKAIKDLVGGGVKDAFTKGFGVVPEDKDPMGLGDETKPLTMPTLDMDVVEEARKRALLLRQQSSGRRSTILADTRY